MPSNLEATFKLRQEGKLYGQEVDIFATRFELPEARDVGFDPGHDANWDGGKIASFV